MTLAADTVRKIVAAKGTQFATVTFIKKDGTERTINGLFKPTSKIVGNEQGQRNSEVLKRNGLIPIFSVAEEKWKCFNENAVVEIK
jgi:hypothetical protein